MDKLIESVCRQSWSEGFVYGAGAVLLVVVVARVIGAINERRQGQKE